MSDTYANAPMLFAYFKWHYGRGLREFLGLAKNFLWFIAHFFSFKLFGRSLFSPWKRLGERYVGGLEITAFASTLVVNVLMRVVGFVIKTTVLCLGLASFLIALVFFVAIFVIWVFAPAILLGFLVLAVTFYEI